MRLEQEDRNAGWDADGDTDEGTDEGAFTNVIYTIYYANGNFQEGGD